MTMKTYHGSCHCGDVRYSAAFDLSQGTAKCTCTICRKTRAWHVVIKLEDFALLSDPALAHEYRWVAPGQSAPRSCWAPLRRSASPLAHLCPRLNAPFTIVISPQSMRNWTSAPWPKPGR